MKQVSQLDTAGYFVGSATADESPLEPGVWLLPAGAVDATPPEVPYGMRARWVGDGFEVGIIPFDEQEPEPPHSPAPTQFELDQVRYRQRAAAYGELMSWMSADNMSRVRTGVWSLPELKSLMGDPAVLAAQAYMSMLSYELAAQSITEATTPLLTPDIKATWLAKLAEHFY